MTKGRNFVKRDFEKQAGISRDLLVHQKRFKNAKLERFSKKDPI